MKTIEERVQILEANFASLQEAFLQSQSNQAESQGQVDNTSNKVEQITPTTYTKTAYIGDTDVVFENVPQGNITVIAESENGYHPYYTELKRENDRVRIRYVVPFESVTTITLSIL